MNLADLTLEEIEQEVKVLGESSFRAKQIYEWIYRGADLDQMTNLSKALRDKLKEKHTVFFPKIHTRFVSNDGTIKYLMELSDGNLIETVLMRYKHGISVCISSQVGCRMGCSFCASTIGSLVRNLSPAEIAGQVITASNDAGERISNVVVMGIGEPLDNYDNLVKALRLLNHGLGIGFRHITVSTCGLLDKIKDLMNEEMPINLAVSLHAPNNEIRRALMPVARAYDIDELIKVCRTYTEVTKRRITFEYALVKGVNDSIQNAKELKALVKNMLCHINLIPVNKIDEAGYEKSNAAEEFMKALSPVAATIRRELGSDINASCGQLRASANKALS